MNGELAQMVQAINEHISTEMDRVYRKIESVEGKLDYSHDDLDNKLDVVNIQVTENKTDICWLKKTLVKIGGGGGILSIVVAMITKAVGMW